MRDPRVPVQDPPFEDISFEHLIWTSKPNCKGLVAYLFLRKLENFCRGWGKTCNCHFRKTSSFDINTSKKKPKKISPRTVFSETTFWCQYGPENHRGKAKVQKLEEGQRRRLTEHDESIKVGCRAHFSAKVYYNEQDVVEITILKVSCMPSALSVPL